MREPHTKVDFFNTCIKCFGKKDEMNEIKNYYKNVLWVCAYLSSFKKIHFCMGLPHTKVGFKRLIHVAPIRSKKNSAEGFIQQKFKNKNPGLVYI